MQRAHALEITAGAAASEGVRAALRAGEAAKRRLLIANHPFLVKLALQFANQVRQLELQAVQGLHVWAQE